MTNKLTDLNQRIESRHVSAEPFKVPVPPGSSISVPNFNSTSDCIEPQKALRYNEGKLHWSMIDFKSLEGMVRVLEMGTKKYSKDNWKLGMPVTEVCESLMRHLLAFMSGETTDQESGCSHMSHVMVNAMFVEYIMRERPHFDDRTNHEG